MSGLQVVSLFAGVGGIDLAAERAGMRTVLLCEKDAAIRKVLAHRFPDAVIHPDVTELTADDLRRARAVPDRTVLTAGFPCQDVSVAGRRAGMGEGTRTGLFFEIIRLLADFPAAWVVLENVPGLLSAACVCRGDESCIDNGRPTDGNGCGEWQTFRDGDRLWREWVAHVQHGVKGGACRGGCIPTHGGFMGAVLGSLAELGYGFAYRVLDARYFGVPQRRARVVIVGRAGDTGTAPAEILFEPESSGGDSPQGEQAWPELAPCLESGANSTGGTRPPGTTVDTAEPLIVEQHTHTHTPLARSWRAATAGVGGSGRTKPQRVISSLGGGGVDR